MAGLNYIDIGIFALIFLSAIIGFSRGFVREAFSLATWIAAIAIAFIFFRKFSGLIPVSNELVRSGIAFLILFIGILVIGGVINHFFNKAIKAAGLGSVDRVLGSTFGVIRGAIVVTLLILLLNLGMTSLPESKLWNQSKLVPHFLTVADWIKKEIPEDVVEQMKSFSSKLGVSDARMTSDSTK